MSAQLQMPAALSARTEQTDGAGPTRSADPQVAHSEADARPAKTSPPSGRRPGQLPRAFRIGATLSMIATAAILGVWAFQFYETSPWTRDGRISAYVVDSAAEVSGQVVEVPVHDNQLVKKDDVLYRIDPRDYQAALKRAQATVDQVQANLELARTAVPENEAKHQFQIYELARVQNLLDTGAGAEFELNQAQRDFDVTKANVQEAKAAVIAREADLEAARAALYKAQIDLERCDIRATVNGWVTNLAVRVGNYAPAGARQMSLIDADSHWITGYFEETRLKRVRVGAGARAALMGFSDEVLLGHVESINRGIADQNLAPNQVGLPQVNPVFTWVRLAQRIPVRIHIDHVPDGVHLAIGETCTIYLDTPTVSAN